jgi:hypothetical protein
VLGILSGCHSLWDLERFAIRHHALLTEALGIELRHPPSNAPFRYFFHQVDVAAMCAAIRDWTIAQIQGGAEALDQLVCDGKLKISFRSTFNAFNFDKYAQHYLGDFCFPFDRRF